jgi:hypothetical protein
MKILNIIFISLLFSATFLDGQGLQDALRYSATIPGGTARTIGAGGAFGALGGDFGALSINPAGLAVYRKSEFVASFGYLSNSIESLLAGENFSTITEEGYPGLENLGIIINKNPIGSKWATSNFAIGYNKIANFNRDYSFSGSTLGSITERWVQLADGIPSGDLDVFETQPAFIAGAIYDFDEDDLYNTDLDQYQDTRIRKEQFIAESGGISELSLSWAGNYDNKFSLGLGLGIPFVNYRELKEYYEDDPNAEIPVFNELQYTEFLNTTGTGINFRGGLIYTPTRKIRVGLSLHSPTYYFLTDDFFSEITYDFVDGNGAQRYTEGSPDGNFQYRFTSPWKAILSIATLYKVGEIQGFVSADVEMRNYANANFNLTSDSNNSADREYQDILNDDIDFLLTNSAIIRLGTEMAYKKLRLRAGMQMDQSPFSVDDGAFDNRYSFGIGLRENRFFIDLALTSFNTGEGYYAYLSENESRDPFVDSDITRNNFVATFGFKF